MEDPSRLLSLPYPGDDPFSREWAVRARTFERFVARVLEPLEEDAAPRPLRLLELGAGNGWLCARAVRRGHHAVALDVRTDAVDGLGAAGRFAAHLPRMFRRVAASFEAIPLRAGRYDVVAFNAALHYAVDLERAMGEAARVARSGGRVAILDSPFYRDEEAGEAMVTEKRRDAEATFGDLADDLMELPAVEYLTRESLERASRSTGLRWRRHRVLYPLWYELRPVVAFLTGRRPPSRFDLWESRVP